MNRKIILSLFFVLGFFSLLSQTLILREFIISYGGNELGIGLFYFFWFFWVGAGAFLVSTVLGKFLSKHFLKLAFFYPILSFLEITLFITLRKLAWVNWWEFFSLEKAFGYLFFLTSFISLFTGVIFTVGVLWLKKAKEEDTASLVTFSYVFEAIGSFFSGGIATVLMLKLSPPIIILIEGSLVFCLITLIASIWFKDRISIVFNAFLFCILAAAFLLPRTVSGVTNTLRMKNVFPAAGLVDQAYTPYQHLLFGKLNNQIVVLSGGEIVNSFPEPIDADKESALFMSQAGFPENILIFGIGAENLIISLLKFPVKSITYCLEDKVYYDVFIKNIPSESKQALASKRLKIVFESSRSFLQNKNQQHKKFGLIIVHTFNPSNLAANAFFTEEFYALANRRLSSTGVLATRITSAENFLGEELRNYGSSLYYTLKEVFPKIMIIPGDKTMFLAGSNETPLTEDPLVLESRLELNFPSDFSFSPRGFRSLLPKERISFVKDMYVKNDLFEKGRLINRDNRPLTFFLDLLVKARHTNAGLVKFFKSVLFAGIDIFIIPILLFFLARVWFLFRIAVPKERRFLFNGKLFQFVSGFLGFSFHLALIFIFQNRFGTIFQLIGLVNACFMLGLCGGGVLGKYFVRVRKLPPFRIIIAVLIIQIIIILTAYPLFTQEALSKEIIFFIFIIYFLASGVLTGFSYPLCAEIFQSNQSSLISTAVNLELFDYWGAALAGILSGVFMLPLLGVVKTMIVLIVICLISIFLFAAEIIPMRVARKQKLSMTGSFPYIRVSYALVVISLCFIINSYLLEKGRRVWEGSRLLTGEESKLCHKQERPFPAYLCKKQSGIEYVLESKDFAYQIKGFGGPMNLSLIIDTAGVIKEIKAVEHKETLAYIGDLDKFLSQFKGRFLKEKFSLNNVDAISGATVSSSAVIDIINEISRNVCAPIPNAESGQKIKGKTIIVDKASVYLIVFTVFSIVGYLFFSRPPALRRIYLLFVIVFLGFLLNFTFSIFHLSNLIMLNPVSFKFLSHILIYVIPLFLGIFLGQFWCGWLCPFGALQEWAGSSKLSIKISSEQDKKMRYFKYILLVIVIIVVSLKRDASFFRQEPLSVFFLNPLQIGRDKLLAFVVLFFSLFFTRFWCRYFCVCGAALSLFNKIAVFGKFFIKKYRNCPYGIDRGAAIDCIQCNVCREKYWPVVDNAHPSNFCNDIIQRKEKFLKLAFLVTLFFMAGVFFSNRERVRTEYFSKGEHRVIPYKVDAERIRKLIGEDKLSDKEAIFYKVLNKE